MNNTNKIPLPAARRASSSVCGVMLLGLYERDTTFQQTVLGMLAEVIQVGGSVVSQYPHVIFLPSYVHDHFVWLNTVLS